MEYKSIILETGDDFVSVITLNRPESLNTFNIELAVELNSALLELDADPKTRVIVIKGSGKGFCAGIDIKDFAGKTASEYKVWIETMEIPFLTMSKLKKPVIAQVHGVAAANGAGIVAACDLAIAGSRARIGLTAINVGLNCVGPVIPVSKSVGRKKALEMLLFGELIKADRACEMGLINRVVADEELEEEARNWAAKLALKSPVALQLAKKSFYTAADMDYEKSFEYMNEAFARLCTTEDAKEGIDAFLNKRKPEWQEK